MNDRLNKLQELYKEKAPTNFTENDKQAIWKNIKRSEQENPIRKHIMPKVATVFALTFALVIGIYFLGDNLPFMNQNGAKNWNQDDAEEVIEGFFKDTDYSNPYFYDHDFSHRNLKIESMSYLSNHLFEVKTNMGHYLFRVNEAYDIDVFDYIEHMEQHQLDTNKHDSRTEEKIYNILKDPSVFESLIGTGEIEGVEHIGGNLYEFITTSFPDTYLAVVDDGAMDVYGPEREIRDFDLTGKGKNWKATYSVRRVGWDNQERFYTLSYIGEENVPEIFDYQSENGGFSGSIDDWNGEPVSLGGSCGGCSTDEDDPIDITFEWDGHTETITLTAD